MSIGGDPTYGQVLTANETPADAAKTFTWYQISSSTLPETDSTSIQDANARSYTVATGDIGKYIYVKVTGDNGSIQRSAPVLISAPAFTLRGFAAADTDNTRFVKNDAPAAGDANLTVYCLSDKLASDNTKPNTITLTFTGAATGEITCVPTPTPTTSPETEREPSINSATGTVVINDIPTGDTFTFTRQSAEYVVNFVQVPKVMLTPADGGGTYTYTYDSTVNANDVIDRPLTAPYSDLLINLDRFSLTLAPEEGNTGSVVYYDVAEPGPTASPTTIVAAPAGGNVYPLPSPSPGQLYNIKVAFAPIMPSASPSGTEGKAADTTFDLQPAPYADGDTTELTKVTPAATTAGATAYNMNVAGDLVGLKFPNNVTDGSTVWYAVAASSAASFGTPKRYDATVGIGSATETINDKDIILFFTDADNWLKVGVTSKALVTLVVDGATAENGYKADFSYDSTPTSPSPTAVPGLNGVKGHAWLDYDETDKPYVQVETTDGEDAAVAAFVTLNGKDQTEVSNGTTPTGEYKVELTASAVYDIVVTFADELDAADEDIAGTVLVPGTMAVDSTHITGGVNFLIPANATLTINGEQAIDKGITVSGQGKVIATAVAAGDGAVVEVSAGTLTVKSLTLDGNAATVKNGGTLEIAGAEGLVMNPGSTLNIAIGSTLKVSENATVNAGATLAIANGATVEIAAAKTLTVNNDLIIPEGAEISLDRGGVLNVNTGNMTIGRDGIKVPNGSAGLVIGAPAAARAIGTMSAADGPSTVTVIESVDLPNNLAVTVNANGKLVVGGDVTADATVPTDLTRITLGIYGPLRGAGDVILNYGTRLVAPDIAGVRVVDRNDVVLQPDDNDTFTARWFVDVDITASQNAALGSRRNLTLTGLEENDYVVVSITSNIAGLNYTRIDTERMTAAAESRTMQIDYNGTPVRILVIVYSGAPDITGEDGHVGAPNLANSSADGTAAGN